ncbi:phosphatidylglycerophosphatase A [Candidatus Neomarinimicrobiota bacterium]
MSRLAQLFSTGLYVGYLRPAPGSWGSLFAAIIWWFISPTTWWLQLLLIILAIAVGVWTSGLAAAWMDEEDPSQVVIDEIAGMWLALLLAPQVWWYYLGAFLLFRVFDIAKPGPINTIQKQPGGWGIMLDDVLAGAAALIIMTAIRLFLP